MQPDNLQHTQVVLDTRNIQISDATPVSLGDWTFVSSFKLCFFFLAEYPLSNAYASQGNRLFYTACVFLCVFLIPFFPKRLLPF